MDFSKWSNVIKLILLRIIDEIEKRINEKNSLADSGSFGSSLYNSLKFVVLDQVDGLADEVVGYTKKQVHDLSNIVVKKISVVLSSMLYVIILIILGLVAFAFIAIAFSLFIGKLLQNEYLGFLISGGLVILITLIVWKWGRERIAKKVNAFLTKSIQ